MSNFNFGHARVVTDTLRNFKAKLFKERRKSMTKDQLISRYKELSQEETNILAEMNVVRNMIIQFDAGTEKQEEPEKDEIPEMVTIKNASERTGLTYSAIRELCLQNKITYIKTGKKYLINLGKLTQYLNGKVIHA